MSKNYFLSGYVSINFIKKDVNAIVIITINIIISFENLSMIFNKRYLRLLNEY